MDESRFSRGNVARNTSAHHYCCPHVAETMLGTRGCAQRLLTTDTKKQPSRTPKLGTGSHFPVRKAHAECSLATKKADTRRYARESSQKQPRRQKSVAFTSS